MEDPAKTEVELNAELTALRQRVAGLEAVEPELVRVAAELQQSKEQYRLLVEEINDIIYTVDRAKVVTYISPVIESVSGYAPAEIVGHSFLDFVFAADVERVDTQFQENISGRLDLAQFRFRVVTKPGQVRWARTFSRPMLVKSRVVGLRGVMTDVSHWVQLEEEREQLIGELQGALGQVKALSGLLPICASCKKIRDEQNHWIQIEDYIRQRSEARFTHAICPECAETLYADVLEQKRD